MYDSDTNWSPPCQIGLSRLSAWRYFCMVRVGLDSRYIPREALMGLLPDTQNCGLRMRRECRERFPRNRLQRKPQVSDPGMHHGTSVTHVPWCMSGLLTSNSGENVPGIPGACATRNFTYLVRGPWYHPWTLSQSLYTTLNGGSVTTCPLRNVGNSHSVIWAHNAMQITQNA